MSAFTPATRWRDPRETRVLLLDPCGGRWEHGDVDGIVERLHPGDVLVVNDAATLPASLTGTSDHGVIEVRLGAHAEGEAHAVLWRALVFGAGSWRVPTEQRPPAELAPGERIVFSPELSAVVLRVVVPGRLVDLAFEQAGDALWGALYAVGRPVQYSYLAADLPLWAVQNAYAARPWALEAPSAGRALTWEVLMRLRARGVVVASLTHAAGLSSTGDADLDRTLPWPEPFDLPERTVRAIEDAKRAGRRVVAVGTSVVRALEGRARENGGTLVAGAGVTDFLLGPGVTLKVVDGLLTGLHEETASHFSLLQAFAPGELVRAAYADARARGYLGHELGDANLILCS